MSYENICSSTPIKCGQTIRLQHLSTGRNLHSHTFVSPLSRNLEVSAFGERGEGDEGFCCRCNDIALHKYFLLFVKHFTHFNICLR